MQEKHYKSPIVTTLEVPVKVSYPLHKQTCYNKSIELPVIQCDDIKEERTIQVPTIEDSKVYCDVCYSKIVTPKCTKIGLQLPKQHCTEFQLEHKPRPSYTPPKPSYGPPSIA